jgi:DNA repair protein RadC
MAPNQLHNYQVSELQVIYKQKFKPSDRPKINSSKESYNILIEGWNKGTIGFIEEFKILLLNRGHRVIGSFEVSSGGICGTIADPKVIFSVALKCCAVYIILAHNHPSGNLKPSQADIQMTQKLCSAGSILDISVLDHIILSTEGYYSFTDEGLI